MSNLIVDYNHDYYPGLIQNGDPIIPLSQRKYLYSDAWILCQRKFGAKFCASGTHRTCANVSSAGMFGPNFSNFWGLLTLPVRKLKFVPKLRIRSYHGKFSHVWLDNCFLSSLVWVDASNKEFDYRAMISRFEWVSQSKKSIKRVLQIVRNFSPNKNSGTSHLTDQNRFWLVRFFDPRFRAPLTQSSFAQRAAKSNKEPPNNEGKS